MERRRIPRDTMEDAVLLTQRLVDSAIGYDYALLDATPMPTTYEEWVAQLPTENQP